MERKIFNIISQTRSRVISASRAISSILPKSRSRRIIVFAVPFIAALSVIAYGYFIPSSEVFGQVYYAEKTPQKEVALTFDDGPNDPYTSQVLDVLDKYNIKATFFEIGRNVELYPQTAQRMLDEGDVIGNHSYTHNANHAVTFYGIRDMQRGEQAIYNTLGVKPRLYRPPHGKKSPWEIQTVHKDGMIEVTWSVESNELAGRTPEQVAQNIINQTRPGGIILLHDGYGLEHNDAHANKSDTVTEVDIVISKLQAEGYQFVTVPQLLGVTPYLNQ